MFEWYTLNHFRLSDQLQFRKILTSFAHQISSLIVLSTVTVEEL